MSPSLRRVNPHHLHSLCDSADVVPRLLRGRMTQLEVPLSASLTPSSAHSSVNCSNLNTVWLHCYTEARTQDVLFAEQWFPNF